MKQLKSIKKGYFSSNFEKDEVITTEFVQTSDARIDEKSRQNYIKDLPNSCRYILLLEAI